MTKKNRPYILLILAALAALLLTGCHSDTPQEPDRETLVTLEVKAPIGIDGEIQQLSGELVSHEDGIKTPLTFDQERATVRLIQGETYTVTLSADFATRGVRTTIDYREDFTTRLLEQYTHPCQLMFVIPKESFVISEIFFAGTRNRKGDQYDEDKFIRITNNSPVTRYADGLALVRSLWQSDEKKERVEPNLMDTHMAVGIVMQIPGEGSSYPVKPYESILLCHSAIDHSAENPNSIDLSGADFEWMSDKGYTDSDTPDNPKVPDMRAIFLSDPYGEGMQNWIMSNNGQHTYALVDLQGKSAEELATDYAYDYSEILVIEGMDPMPLPGEPALKIPHEWVLDTVNLSMPDNFQWLPVSDKLDAGYAFVAATFNDDARYGMKVVRKLLAEGEAALQDSNNSSNDFQAVPLK